MRRGWRAAEVVQPGPLLLFEKASPTQKPSATRSSPDTAALQAWPSSRTPSRMASTIRSTDRFGWATSPHRSAGNAKRSRCASQACHLAGGSENSQGLFLAVARPDVHPSRITGLSVGGLHFVIDGRIAMLLQVIHITKRTLVISRQFGNPLLSLCWARAQHRQGKEYGGQSEGTSAHRTSNQGIKP